MSAEASLGPLEIGVLLSSAIFGVTCLQCYLYFANQSANDSFALKSLVAILMTLETLYTVFIGHMLYFYSVESFGEIEKLATLTWSYTGQRVISSVACTITQYFFAIRVYYLNGHHLSVPILIAITSVVNIIVVIGVTIIGSSMPKPLSHQQLAVFGRIAFIKALFSLCCDVIITTSIIYYLRKSRTQIAGVDRAIYKLIRYTLNTGLLITFFTLITSVFYLKEQEFFSYTPFDFILTRLYACSLISTLNSRAAVQKEFARVGRGAGTSNNVFTTVALELSIFSTANDHE